MMVLAIAACFAGVAGANPTGPTVVNGSASMTSSGNTLTVVNTPGTIINWQAFSIRPDEVTRFVQSGAASAVLNRVTGAEPSALLGQLLSNGRVFLVNPNGVTVGGGAIIDTAGFVASTLNLSNDDFLAGRFRFTDPGNPGAIANHGTIQTTGGGPVYLIAPTVENHGVIRAPGGEILLAAGKSVELVTGASPHLRVEVKAAEGGDALNVGRLVADSGRVGIYGATIRNSGVVSADTATVDAAGAVVLKASRDVTLGTGSKVTANGPRGGTIEIQADEGTLLASGTVEAKGAAGTGGDVKLLGDRVGLVDGATVDASGTARGGNINVGGSREGAGPLPNSRAVFVGADARIAANATRAGNGGAIIVYAEDSARVYGALEAKGGPGGGNGGFVETSGKQFLEVTTLPDVTAPAGRGGEWLIDPYNITITTTANQCTSLTGCTTGPSWTSNANNAQLGVNLINNALNAGTSVTITTGVGGAQAGNITFANNAAVNKIGGGNASLTVTAANNITFNTGANIASLSGTLDVNLNAGAGGITSLRAVNTNGGTLTLDSPGAITQAGVISGSGALVKNGTGTLTLSQNNTYTGATTINAGTLALGAANRIANASAVTVAAGATFNLAGFAETVGSIAGAGNVTLGTGTLTAGGNNGSTAFSGVISGTGGLTKAGTGTLTLSGTNTYTGTTTIARGTLRLAGGNAIADTGAVSLANTAGVMLDLAGTNESIGSLAGGGATGGNVTLGGATLTTGGNNASTTYSGAISGTGGLTKQGTGTLTLGGANTYTGATTINAGRLALSAANRISDASAVNVAAGATFSLAGFAETIGSIAGAGNITLGAGTLTAGGDASTTSFSGVISGTGGLAKTGTGTLTLAGSNTYTGATTINAGTLQIAASERIANTSAVTVAGGAVFDLSGFNETVGSIAGAGSVTLGGGTLTTGGNNASTAYSGVISGTGGLTKIGTGTLTLSGANNYTGTTAINAGTVTLGGAERIADASAVVLGGGTLNLNGFSETVGSIAGTSNIALGAGTLTAGGNNTSTVYSGVIGGTGGSLTKAGTGTLTLSGSNTYTGATTINAGTLQIGASERIANTSAVTVAGGAVFDLSGFNETVGSLAGSGDVTLGSGTLTAGGNNASTTFSGLVSGAGGLTKAGTGTLTLSGANTYAGATNVNAGTVVAANAAALGSAAGGTTVASGATLTLDNVAIGAEAVTLNGTGIGAAGALRGIGIASLDGNVTLNSASSIGVGAAGDTLVLSGVVSGAFALTKAGAGTLVLSGANTYTGATSVNAGTLVASSASALGITAGGTTVAAGATLNIDDVAIGGEAMTLNGTLVGTGAASLAGNVALGAASAINTAGAGDTLTLSGVVSGTSALNKNGAGTLVLSGAASNTYTGVTNVNAGTLVAAKPGALGTTAGGTTVADGATLTIANVAIGAENITLNGAGVGGAGALQGTGIASLAGSVTLATAGAIGAPTAGDTLTISGTVGGANSFTKVGSGIVVFSGATANTYGGATNIDAGTLRIGSAANKITDSSAVTVATGATLDLNGFSETVGSLAGSGDVTLGGGTLTAGGNNASTTFSGLVSGAGGLTKTGTGTLTLSGANTYASATNVNAGTLVAANVAALGSAAGGTTVASGATLTLDNVAIGAEAVTLNGTGVGAAGALRGIGTASLGGNITLAGASRVAVAPASTLTLNGSVNGAFALDVAGVGTVTFGAPVGDTIALASLASAGGTAVNVAGGSVRTTGAQTYDGTLTTAGATTLQTTNASVSANGPVTATAGTLTLNTGTGDVTMMNAANDFVTVSFPSSGSVVVTDANALTIGTSTVRTLTAQTLSGDLTLGGNVVSTLPVAGNAIVLSAAGNVQNPASFTLSPGAGRWLIYSGSPSGTALGGLAPGFKRYNCTLAAGCLTAGTTIPGTGNGVLYSVAPTIDVTADAVTVVYGATSGPLTYSTAGFIDGDTAATALAGALARTPGASSAGGYEVVGTTAIAQGTLASPLGYQINYSGANYTITPRAVTAGLTGTVTKVYDATTAATLAPGNYALSGVLPGDVVLLNNPAAGAYDNPNAGIGKAVSVAGLALLGADAANYAVNPAASAAIGTITPASLTVSAESQSKTYGAPDPTLTFAASGFRGTDTAGTVLSGSLSRVPGETVADGPYAIIQGSLASNPNYTIAYAGNVLTITPAGLVISANDALRQYGDPNPAFTATFTGLVNGDTPAAITGLAFSTPATVISGVGGYAVTPTSNPNLNYTIAYTNGTLTVVPAPLAVQANDASRRFGEPNPPFSATYSGFKLGEMPANLAGTLVLATPATAASLPGVYSITPSGVSSANYAITFVDGTLVVASNRAPEDPALVSAMERGAATPGASAGVALDCLVIDQRGNLRVLGRCY